jgi:hypothetical protein
MPVHVLATKDGVTVIPAKRERSSNAPPGSSVSLVEDTIFIVPSALLSLDHLLCLRHFFRWIPERARDARPFEDAGR